MIQWIKGGDGRNGDRCLIWWSREGDTGMGHEVTKNTVEVEKEREREWDRKKTCIERGSESDMCLIWRYRERKWRKLPKVASITYSYLECQYKQ